MPISLERLRLCASALPTRRLAVRVRFPRGFWPLEVFAHASPTFAIPRDREGGLLEELHPGSHELRCRRRAGTVSLEVEEPLIGVNYALSWRLP